MWANFSASQVTSDGGLTSCFVSVFQLCSVIVWAWAAGTDETDWHYDQSSEEGVGGRDAGHAAQAEKWRRRAVDFQESHWTEGPGGEAADPCLSFTGIHFIHRQSHSGIYCFVGLDLWLWKFVLCWCFTHIFYNTAITPNCRSDCSASSWKVCSLVDKSWTPSMRNNYRKSEKR